MRNSGRSNRASRVGSSLSPQTLMHPAQQPVVVLPAVQRAQVSLQHWQPLRPLSSRRVVPAGSPTTLPLGPAASAPHPQQPVTTMPGSSSGAAAAVTRGSPVWAHNPFNHHLSAPAQAVLLSCSKNSSGSSQMSSPAHGTTPSPVRRRTTGAALP